MTILHREIEWLQGIDPRSPVDDRTEWALGYIRGSDWSHPSGAGFSRYLSAPGVVGSHFRPFLTQLVPFATDGAGVTYDTDQLFAVFGGAAGGGFTGIYGQARTPGDATNPLNIDYPYITVSDTQSKRESWVIYRATNVPAGASPTLKFFDTFGNPTLGDYTIPSAAYVRNICQYIPAQTINYDEDPNPYIEVDWSGGVPTWESVNLSVLCTSAIYVPVPATLDAAYTARTAHDVERGGIFGDRKHADRRRGRATPASWEPPIPSGLAAYDQAQFWLSGVLKTNSWLPVAIDGAFSELSAAVGAWPSSIPIPYPLTDPQVAGPLTTAGAYALTLDVTYGFVTGMASFKVEVLEDASIIHSGTYNSTSTGITIAATLPAHGTTVAYTLKVYAPTGMSGHWDDGVTVRLRISPRRDIPYPFALVGHDPTGDRLAAPGGYLPGKIADYVPAANVARLGAGVTHATAKSSFKPAADAWYQTKNGGGTLISGGADDFGSGDSRQIDRGRTNQPYYIGGAGDLSVYTPSPHAIASGGTDLTPTVGNWWEWGTVAFTGAGSWLVSILCKNVAMLKRGLVAEWSAAKATVIHPDGQAVFETLDEGVGFAGTGSSLPWAGSDTTPPGSPLIYEAHVVLPNATGVWSGHDNQIALWDDIVNAWIYFTPNRGSYLVNVAGTDWTWFDGVAWKAKTDPVITIPVTTTGALTWGLSIRQFSLERSISGSPTATVKWAAA